MPFETDLSAEPKAPGQNTWLPDAHANSGGAQCLEAPASEGPSPPDSLRARLASQAFPKSYRLLRRSEYRRVYDEGQRRSAALCIVFFLPNGLPHPRLGITTPARLGKAVLRNRVRRRLREVFRLNRPTLPGGWDILVNPRPAVAEVPFRILERELLRLLPTRPPDAPFEQGPGQ